MSLSQKFFSSKKYPLLTLLIIWLGLQSFLLYHFGIETHFESKKYIDEANNFLTTGGYTTNNFAFYSVQILLISLSIKFGLGFIFIVIVQWIFNAFSTFLFYKLIARLTQSNKAALYFTLALLAMIYYQLYNVYLFTESLFFSFSIIFAYYLFTLKRLTFLAVSGIIASLVILTFTRPTGLLFIPGTIFFLILRFGGSKKLILFVSSIVVGSILFYFLLNKALNAGGEFDFLLPYIQEHIICGVPTVQQEHIITLPVNHNSVEGLWYLIRNNSNLFFRLALKRFIAFWGVRRSYYSLAHNLYVSVYFYLIYALIISGLRRFSKSFTAEFIFLITYILLVSLTVLLSCDEWHNRFLFSILPFLWMLATGLFVKKHAST